MAGKKNRVQESQKVKYAGLDVEKDKLKYAKKLSNTHLRIEGTISGVAYISSPAEGDANEPLKLLEINSATSASGVFPVTFGPTDEIPYNSTLVELTPGEARELEKGKLPGWPGSWKIDRWLYRRRTRRSRGRR